jgi:tripartite-type tricarboxylate transporter receptor subunit TctC
MIVGFVPGGGSDLSARIVSDVLSQRLGQSVVVENRPGASSVLGVEYVAKSPPDGYTLLHTNSDGITLLPAVKKNIPYSVPKDFSFIARVLELPLAITVRKDLPVNSLPELIAYAKANPGKITYGTSGVGSGPHLASLLLQREAGIQMTHAPYRGSGGAINDLLGGHLDMALPAVQAVAAQAKAGELKVLAVTGPKRDPLMPDVPTVSELGYPGATVVIWYGILGPANMPPDVLAYLRKQTVEALNSPEAKAKFKAAGFNVDPLSGEDFEPYVAKEADLWKGIAENAHISITE